MCKSNSQQTDQQRADEHFDSKINDLISSYAYLDEEDEEDNDDFVDEESRYTWRHTKGEDFSLLNSML